MPTKKRAAKPRKRKAVPLFSPANQLKVAQLRIAQLEQERDNTHKLYTDALGKLAEEERRRAAVIGADTIQSDIYAALQEATSLAADLTTRLEEQADEMLLASQRNQRQAVRIGALTEEQRTDRLLIAKLNGWIQNARETALLIHGYDPAQAPGRSAHPGAGEKNQAHPAD